MGHTQKQRKQQLSVAAKPLISTFLLAAGIQGYLLLSHNKLRSSDDLLQPHSVSSPSTRLVQQSSPSTPVEILQRQRHHTDDVCYGYDGILFISHVIRKAGAGTLFFQSIVDSLIYAEMYNLYPFLHINDDLNTPCYDPKVHGIGQNITFLHKTGTVGNKRGSGTMACKTSEGTRPGKPQLQKVQVKRYTLIGNGLWASYFHPISPPSTRCPQLPMVEMTNSQVMPDMHRCSEFAVRGWPFRGIPDALLPQPEQSMQDWLWQSRDRASRIVQRYFRPLPWLRTKIDTANPIDDEQCLALHIRLTDKASGRDKKGVEAYLPYAKAYARASKNTPIYVATDDGTVIDTLRDELSSPLVLQPGVLRSDSNIPTFKLLANDKHRSNTEALVEMYAMSKCGFFVHGFSGMAEAVVYINPRLHDLSVNIDDVDKPSPQLFEKTVRQTLEMRQK